MKIFCVLIAVACSLSFDGPNCPGLVGQQTKQAQSQQVAANTQSPYLAHIQAIDHWLESVMVTNDGIVEYPVAIEQPELSSNHLYSGLPGVMLYYLQAWRVTRNPLYQRKYQRAARSVEHAISHASAEDNPGLFTGYTGLGWVLVKADAVAHRAAIKRCVELLDESVQEKATESENRAVTWNDTTDVIGGSAGIGFFLLEAHNQLQIEGAFELAVAAGHGLIVDAKPVQLAEPGEQGLRWMMNPAFPREMPNYSHGTAGICDFLLALDETCQRQQRQRRGGRDQFNYHDHFRAAALQGARYLTSLEAEFSNGKALLPHHFPDGERLIYLGWCHGPVGTCQLANRLAEGLAAPDSAKNWTAYNQRAAGELVRAQLFKNRTDGFWNNVGICCGSAGVGSFLLDQAVAQNNQQWLAAARLLADDIISRGRAGQSKDARSTLCWPSAEHRVRPELIQTQTGLMQGAAGIGLFLLQLEALHRHPDQRPFSIFGDLFP